MKKKKGPLILTGVLVILLIVYFGLSSWNKKQDKKEEKETVKVTDLDESTITAIKYQVAAGEMSFEKEGDTWYYSEDKDFPLKQSKPEAIVKAAAQITADRKLEDGDSLDAYGLDDPNYSIEITEEDGTVTTVSFGDSTGTDYYVTVGDTGTVYTVASSVLDDFKTEVSDFAQLDEYPSIGSGNLKKEVITENGTTTTYDSENEDQEEEIAAVAGGLGAVSLTTVADYSVEDADLAGYGLDEASRITVEATYTKNEDEKTMKMYISSDDGNGNRYVMLDGSKIVYQISDEVCKNILNQE